MKPFLVLVAMCLSSLSSFAQGIDTLQLKTIFQEPYLAGVRPSFANFSLDGKQLIYSWNDSARSGTEYFITDFSGKKSSQIKDITTLRSSISPNGQHYVYSEKGDLWLGEVKSKKTTRLTQTKSFEFGATWSPDSKRIAFVQEGDVMVINVDKPGFINVTNKKEKDANYSISTWLGNSELIVNQSVNDESWEVYFPEYVGKMVKPGNSKRGIGTTTVKRVGVDSSFSKQIWEGKGWLVQVDATTNGQFATLGWLDENMKSRTIFVLDATSGNLKTAFSDSTSGWIDFSFTSAKFAPNDQFVIFESEKSGWNHLYRMDADGSNIKQLTNGNYEISYYDFLSNSDLIIATSETDPGERHLYLFDIKNQTSKQLTKNEGFRQDFRLSTDKKHVVYEKTIWNDPLDLFVLNIKKATETRITDSAPARFKAVKWQTPTYWRFTGRDKATQISMTLLKPKDASPDKKYPVVVFVHGAGSLQNVYKGWSSNYWREYLFHQYLTTKGYVVIEVDYRHSTGYGRKFREDVTNWMGKYETNDIVDGLDYAQSQLGYLDLDKVGIYGGSYGGFMALYAVSAEPNRFHAAAALRAVTNWENYYHANPWYTLPRLGTPEKNPENYKRSSPLTFADSLKRPVYILHGLIDNNVGFQDAAQYVEKLIQSGNQHFEMMMYPTERHSFSDPDAWSDEYRRIFGFFEKELK